MNYFSIVNLPVNGIKDMITGIVYDYETGNEASRRAAEIAAKAAQDAVIVSLGIPANKDSDLVNLQLAYIALQ